MVLATRLNHPFSARKGCATDNIATESYKAMSIWFVVAWDWLMTAHRAQKCRHRERAKTLQSTCHDDIATRNKDTTICKHNTFRHNVKDAIEQLIVVLGCNRGGERPRRSRHGEKREWCECNLQGRRKRLH